MFDDAENPYQSPAVPECIVPANPQGDEEFAFGIIVLALATGGLFLLDEVAGAGAAILTIVSVLRSWIELRRKQAADWKLSWGAATWMLVYSIACVVAAAIAGFVAFYGAGYIGLRLHLSYPGSPAFTQFNVLFVAGFIGLMTGLALVYFSGPRSVDKLRQQFHQQNPPVLTDQGNIKRDRT